MKTIEKRNGKLYAEVRLKTEGSYVSYPMILDTTKEVTSVNQTLFPKGEIETMSIGPLKVSDFPVVSENIEEAGIIGLDFLLKTGAKLNLDTMTISSSRT
ncbi:hypothetical protein [Alkalicoccus urumqiensis]|uniref:Uncharacterized protein n=1 Tax=Alkalicoccus urumqiensis TaxID=1548213 RepID=A0A2P6ML13_ALKUR|nr:hypothetical protein [Alkalicoccus urumqiensis]PRO66953.1 hypothetical protein C6I21_03250 [Alkalicoccus urumqiensis]